MTLQDISKNVSVLDAKALRLIKGGTSDSAETTTSIIVVDINESA